MPSITPDRFQTLLDGCCLDRLFNELGWDHAELGPQSVSVNGESFTLTPVAHKRGVVVFVCSPEITGFRV